MSHLRAPAARADRREGGRHGRPVAHPVPSLPETRIRPQLLRLAVLPPVAVALGAGAAVLFTVRSTGARPGPALWAVLAGALAVTLAGIAAAAVAAGRAARSVHERLDALRRSTVRREADLHALVDSLRHGEAPPQRKPRGGPPADADEFELLAADLARAHEGAVTAVVQAAQLSSQAGSEQKLEVFVNLARRLQSLVHREISILDELENEIEDPELLKGLFHVDHLATRIRRHAENLAVLGGAVSRRQWSRPVSMTEVLRSAIAEVEQYSRVKLVPPIDGRLRGHAVADVIHLLAELVENATVFSAPHTQVLLRAGLVTSGLAVEVEDRGLGMPVGEQVRMNALLADPDQVNVASLLADGRIGLFVVSQLARRHGITVRLQTNIYGGVQAVLVVPQALLGAETGPGEAGAGSAGSALAAPGGGAGVRPGAHVPRETETRAGAERPPGADVPTEAEARTDAASGVPQAPVPPPYPAVSAAHPADAHPAPSGHETALAVVPPGHDTSAASVPSGRDGSGASVPFGRDALAVPAPFGHDGLAASVPAGRDGSGASVPSGRDALAVPAPFGHDGLAASVPAGRDGSGTSVPSGRDALADSAPCGQDGGSPTAVPPGQEGSVIPAPAGQSEHPRSVLPSPADGTSAAGPYAPPGGGGPAPLPRRGAGHGRANPSEAVPGIRPEDRAAVAEHAGTLPVPRGDGMVRGTMDRPPQLPRRRAQQHLVPQLRGGPAAPRQDSEDVAGHDPGLMAAFQRGIVLAETQQRRAPFLPDAVSPAGPGLPSAAASPEPWVSPDLRGPAPTGEHAPHAAPADAEPDVPPGPGLAPPPDAGPSQAASPLPPSPAQPRPAAPVVRHDGSAPAG
ncbi:ATP-binding protein [Streptomyces sp. NRRL S-340]|uniref:ATP-binding protein n=1 Tax=Streptomyces sp. NRRL S-340 TaxID=1463901 RepID=UPI00055AB664|nr:ATP-binding protein [Streptomyces sp. NRRL S-340]